MSLKVTVSFILDGIDEWSEDDVTRIPLAVRTIMETESMRIADRLTDAGTGCDLYGWRPIYRADGELAGGWRAESAPPEGEPGRFDA